MLVGTAGHVDHGKSALVRRLTGTDPDRLPEERARGISIALGFAVAELPGGARAAFVDVPGHERFVRTMVSGAHALDAAVLCVSCEDGVMPQTREHLDVLRLLGVPAVVVALTFADRAEGAFVELVAEDVVALLADTPFAGAALVPFSAVTGEGEQALRDALSRCSRRGEDEVGVPWLAVDRAFHQRGRGLVVTGSLRGGALRVGADVWCWPSAGSARIRGIEQHGHPVDVVASGSRVALNLVGAAVASVGRGTVIAGAPMTVGDRWDVWVDAAHCDSALRDGDAVRLLVGTADLSARVRLPPGELLKRGEAPAQLRLDQPWPAEVGLRFVLRRPSPAATLGGGEVLDAQARPLRRRSIGAWSASMLLLRQRDSLARLARAGEAGAPRDAQVEGAVCLADRVVAPEVLEALVDRLRRILGAHHDDRPLSRGLPIAELRDRFRRLSSAALAALVERAHATGAVMVDDGHVCTRQVRWSPTARAARDRALRQVRERGLRGLPRDEVEIPSSVRRDDLLARLIESDEIVLVPGVGAVAGEVIRGLPERLSGLIGPDGATAAALRDGLGVTRKTLIPLLEWCDSVGMTRREGDRRLLGPALRG